MENSVTSLAEVWIEIIWEKIPPGTSIVTSLAEVWIEIYTCLMVCQQIQSLPLRKCGLKCIFYAVYSIQGRSLPLRKCGLKFEAWGWPYEYISHFPCGSVD